jgi:hypothetical protein
MRPATPFEDPTPRPSQLIAEALVERLGPRRIAKRAARLGFSPQLTHVVVIACGATANQSRDPDPPQLSALSS